LAAASSAGSDSGAIREHRRNRSADYRIEARFGPELMVQANHAERLRDTQSLVGPALYLEKALIDTVGAAAIYRR